MNRRHFLQSVPALALWPPASDSPTPLIKKVDRGYLIEIGCLRCSLHGYRNRWTSTFGVILTTHSMPGMVEETRMVPTETLKQRLEAVGIPTARDRWIPEFLFLVCDTDCCPSPHDIAQKMRQILAGVDPRLLYSEPCGWQSDLDEAEFEVR